MRSIQNYLILLVLFTATFSSAKYRSPDLEKVPIKTLIANLEKALLANPEAKSANHHHLARAYAMAYSKNLVSRSAIEIRKETNDIWFGYSPPYVPYAKFFKQADSKNTEAKTFLLKAITHYKAALESAPKDPTLLLGYGWCLEQAGQKTAAIGQYRASLKEFWNKDSKRKGVFGPVGTLEGAEYLIPLLHATKDHAEIKTLKARVRKLKSLPRARTPIAIGLSSDIPLENVVDSQAKVTFDADGTGRQLAWSWIKPGAGWLVYDFKGNGEIDTAIQLFGNRTFNLFLENGYAAMSLLDANSDRQLTGHELENLAIWNDKNSDGISDPGEVTSVESYGIHSLKTEGAIHPSGILYAPQGVSLKNGSFLPSFDVLLHRHQ